MKKLMMVAAMAVLGVGMAGAQTTWKSEVGETRVTGCYVIKEGVRCDLTYTNTSEDSQHFFVNTDMFQVITTDGLSIGTQGVAVAGGQFETYGGTTVYKDAPIKFSLLFGLPATTSTLRVLAYQSKPLNNIPVQRSTAAAPTPRPATTTAPVNISAYNAVLTNCKSGADGTLTCSATLTPRR